MKLLKAMIALALTAGTFQVYAQQHTNLVQNLSIQLYGIKQGRTTTNNYMVTTGLETTRLDTRQIIQALAVATANSFSSTGKLVLITPLTGAPRSIQVRDGSSPPVDVTAFFELQPMSDALQSAQRNLRTGRSVETDYYVLRLALRDVEGFNPLTVHFNVQGLAVGSSTSGIPNRSGADAAADVCGSGDRNGNLLILQGSVGVVGHATEVVDDEWSGTS